METELKYAENWINSQKDSDKIWNFFATEEPPKDKGYSWWDHPMLNRISDGLANRGHCGSSFACTMRNVQVKAKEKIL